MSHRHVPEDDGVHSTDAIVREATKIIAAHAPENGETAEEEPEIQPLFLYLPFVAPHLPTQPAPGYAERNTHIDESLTDMSYRRPDATTRREFAGMVTHLDDAMRQIAGAMEAAVSNDRLLTIFLAGLCFHPDGAGVVGGDAAVCVRGQRRGYGLRRLELSIPRLQILVA